MTDGIRILPPPAQVEPIEVWVEPVPQEWSVERNLETYKALYQRSKKVSLYTLLVFFGIATVLEVISYENRNNEEGRVYSAFPGAAMGSYLISRIDSLFTRKCAKKIRAYTSSLVSKVGVLARLVLPGIVGCSLTYCTDPNLSFTSRLAAGLLPCALSVHDWIARKLCICEMKESKSTSLEYIHGQVRNGLRRLEAGNAQIENQEELQAALQAIPQQVETVEAALVGEGEMELQEAEQQLLLSMSRLPPIIRV